MLKTTVNVKNQWITEYSIILYRYKKEILSKTYLCDSHNCCGGNGPPDIFHRVWVEAVQSISHPKGQKALRFQSLKDFQSES